MDISWRADRLAVSVCLLALAACGGGGGQPGTTASTPTQTGTTGSTSPTGTTSSTGSNTGSTGTTAQITIGPADNAAAGAGFLSFNFSSNPPPVGTAFSLLGPAVKITSTAVGASGIDSTRSRATYRGTVTSNGLTYPVFDLTIPDISVNATGVRGDGTPFTTSDGGKVVAAIGTLNYTLLGAWGYTSASGATGYLGMTVNGTNTNTANVPTTGTATYNGTQGPTAAGAVGAYFVPSGSGSIVAGTLTGNVSLTTDFASNAVNGTMSNMMATPTGGGTTTPWNTITLSGTIGRSTGQNTVAFGGPTTTQGAPSGAGNAGFSSAASGSFAGYFYGPHAEEVGATWTLSDPNAAGGGKTAFGAFAGTK